jgi:galactokinase
MLPLNPASELQFKGFESLLRGDLASFFTCAGPIVCVRAPGRLDVMGGVADYSGGTVLEGTIAEATFSAAQENSSGEVSIVSLSPAGVGAVRDPPLRFQLSLERLFPNGDCINTDEARAILTTPSNIRWAAYVAGCLYMLIANGALPPDRVSGIKIAIESSVPIGAGVSSSAALEVASMSAICGLYDIELSGLEIARLCQKVENVLAGAPCGIMDQVTSALGRKSELLVLKCQPQEVLGFCPVPKGCEFVGIDSGVKHSVGGGHYTRARVAAFIGLKILETIGRGGLNGYLCNMSPEEWTDWRAGIPERLSGTEFLAKYGDLPDTATTVDPETIYNVRSCTEHPIFENDRVRQFISLMSLAGPDSDDVLLEECGQLMLEAHTSYSEKVDLGSDETDLLVKLAMDLGPDHGIFGAKITGGGSGGTVAMLCSGSEVDESINRIREEYQRSTGIEPLVMRGSSCGAMEFGTRQLMPKGT